MNIRIGFIVVAGLLVADVAAAQGARCAGGAVEWQDRLRHAGIGPFLPSEPTNPWAGSLLPAEHWRLTGPESKYYVAGIDHQMVRDGRPSAYLRSAIPSADGFASVTQQRDVKELRGKRIRLGAWLRAEDLTGYAGLWMRVEGAGRPVLAFDNLRNRPRGEEWVWSEVVLDIPENATSLTYGFAMNKSGAAWVNGLKFEEVDTTVATTEVGL